MLCVIEVIVDRLKGNQLGKMVSVDDESRFAPPYCTRRSLPHWSKPISRLGLMEQEFATCVVDRLVVYDGEEIGLRVLSLTYESLSVFDTIA